MTHVEAHVELLHEDRIILDLCGGTGSWSNPYARAGYDVKVITWPENDVRLWPSGRSGAPRFSREFGDGIEGYIGKVHGILMAPPARYSLVRGLLI